MPHDNETVSPWIERFAPLVPAGGIVLDLACGSGRHARFFAARGCRVVAVDRDPAALATLRGIAAIEVIEADLENAPWPLDGRRFAAVVVTNYLHRPLLAQIVDSVAPDGVLLYETFARGNERFGRPSNPQFLLREEELLEAVRDRLQVMAYENLTVTTPRPALLQRICAIDATGADRLNTQVSAHERRLG